MRIFNGILEEILLNIPPVPPETGGILGGSEDIISVYAVDDGIKTIEQYDHYFPDTDRLNCIIQNWSKNGIDFYGIFHTHFPGGVTLSNGDKKYITRIMNSMPQQIHHLYFPILLPKETVVYRADRVDGQIQIVGDDIEIV